MTNTFLRDDATFAGMGFARATVGDANANLVSVVNATTTAFTSPRTWTFPSAGSVPAGTLVIVNDEAGAVSSTNTLTLAVQSGEKLNGVTNGTLVLSSANNSVDFESDGATNWLTFGKTASIGMSIDGSGAPPSAGVKAYLEVPFACKIVRATLLADQSGSAVVDIFKCTYAQFDAGSTHPVAGDKITASAPPTISSATKAQDSTLSGWTTALNAGDIIAFNVNSATTVNRVTISLLVVHAG